MSHSYKEPFIGGVCSAVWARQEGNWKCPPRIYGVRNGRGRTLGGEGRGIHEIVHLGWDLRRVETIQTSSKEGRGSILYER